jgi:hypothetical protein
MKWRNGCVRKMIRCPPLFVSIQDKNKQLAIKSMDQGDHPNFSKIVIRAWLTHLPFNCKGVLDRNPSASFAPNDANASRAAFHVATVDTLMFLTR